MQRAESNRFSQTTCFRPSATLFQNHSHLPCVQMLSAVFSLLTIYSMKNIEFIKKRDAYIFICHFVSLGKLYDTYYIQYRIKPLKDAVITIYKSKSKPSIRNLFLLNIVTIQHSQRFENQFFIIKSNFKNQIILYFICLITNIL